MQTTSSSSGSVKKGLQNLKKTINDLLVLLSEKEKAVIQQRFNLFGSGKKTLEEIGMQFSVTRERVRQIESNALAKIRRNVFNTDMQYIHQHISRLLKKNNGLARKDLIIKEIKNVMKGYGIENIDTYSINLALELHSMIDVVGNTISFHPYLKRKEIKGSDLKSVSATLIKELKKAGDTRDIKEIHDDLKTNLEELDFDLTKIKALIKIDKRLKLVKKNQIGLTEWRHINPRTLGDKTLYILRNEKKPMHFSAIVKKISEAKFDQRKVNPQAVHNELIRNSNFVLIGRGIYALSEWGYQKGTVAEVVVRALREEGEMSQDEIVKYVLDRRQVRKITIILALKNSEKIERIGRKQYRLRK